MPRKKRVTVRKNIIGVIPSKAEKIIRESTIGNPDVNVIEGCYYILIFMVKYLTVRKKKKSEKGIPISSTMLRSVFTNYSDYINLLIKLNLIAMVKDYYKGAGSRKYKIVGYSEIKSWSKVEIKNQKTLDKYYKRKEERRKLVEKKYNFLTKWFNEKLNFTSEFPIQSIAECGPDSPNYNSIFYLHTHYEQIVNHEFHYSTDQFGGRFYSNLTNLKKDYRKYLWYDGNLLAAIDIKNSQPFFLAVLINNMERPDFDKWLNNLLLTPDIRINKNLKKAFYNVNQFGNNFRYEEEEFIHLVCSGELYSFISQNLDCTISHAKNIILPYLFGEDNRISNDARPLRDFFKKQWPDIYHFISELKKGDNTIFSKIMQSVERYYVLMVVEKFSALYPDVCVYTIHDSIVTLDSHINELQIFATKILAEETGLKPKLKLEFWYDK